MLVIGADRLLLYASSEWGAILDGPISAAIGRPLLDPPLVESIGAAGLRSFSEHLEALRAGRRRDPIEFGCEHPKGTERFYEGRAYEAWDEPGVLVLLHDTTANRKLAAVSGGGAL